MTRKLVKRMYLHIDTDIQYIFTANMKFIVTSMQSNPQFENVSYLHGNKTPDAHLTENCYEGKGNVIR